MIGVIILTLLALWLLGYIAIPGLVIPRFPLFHFLGRSILLWDILIFLLIIFIIDILPSPLRQVAIILLILWLLSTFGIIVFVGFSHLLVIGLVALLVVSLFRHHQ